MALLGLAVPWVTATPITSIDVIEAGVAKANVISARADDEWELIAYSGTASNSQCTGTSETITGTSGNTQCARTQTVKTVACVDVSINTGFVNCAFKFSRESSGCSSSIPPDNTVNVNGTGTSVSGQNVDDVTFYTVVCGE